METLNRRIEVTGTLPDGKPVSAVVPIHDLPPYEFMLHLPPPGILEDRAPEGSGNPRMSFTVPESNPLRRLRERLGWSAIRTPVTSFPITGFMRVLAKIGHAYATAEIPRGRFVPALCDFILGDISRTWYYVGGFEPERQQSPKQLDWRIEAHGGRKLVVVDISLQIFPQLPRYQVVCGDYVG